MTMNDNEILFMTAALAISDTQEGGSGCIDSVDPFVAELGRGGLSEKQVWGCELSLARSGHIYILNCDINDVDPTWQRALEFMITGYGFKWLLIRKHGKTQYSKWAGDIKKTITECHMKGISTVAEWAKELGLPLALVNRIIVAENLL